MFCDLVDSVGLGERLDPESLRDILRDYQHRATKIVEAAGGLVARYHGDGILIYFGYPVVSEDDAERAIRAGLELIKDIESLPPSPEKLFIRVGIATGMAFDQAGNLYVGDRSGTIFKISPSREIFVFATMEPSIAAYHLAFHPSGDLYVTGPTTSSFDRVHRITQGGDVSVFFRGLGRPQGLAFDRDANLYVAGSYGGRRGIVRITPQAHADIVLSGSGLVGLALQPSGRAILATTGAIFTLDWDVRGLPLVA